MLLLGIVEVAFGCVCRPGVAWWANWPPCQAAPTGTPGCIGSQLGPDQPCFAHTDHHARAAALGRLRRGGPLDFVPGVELTEELLAEVVAAAPTGDGRRVLRDADLRGVRFQGEARFDQASFQGQAWFDWASFQGGALFSGASFRGGALFGGASFQGDAGFLGASFEGDAGFGGASSRARQGSTGRSLRAARSSLG
jgi:hypothetical protein